MKLSQLYYFKTVCAYNNISQAAKASHISQPSLSIAIKDYEDELGVQLFNRNKNGLSLTKEGEIVLSHVDGILEKIDELTNDTRILNKRKELNSIISVAIPYDIGSIYFSEIFLNFMKLYPEIKLNIYETQPSLIVHAIKSNEVDMAVTMTNEFNLSDLNVFNVCQNNLMLYTNVSGRFAHRDAVSIKELSGEPLVIFNEKSYYHRRLNELFKEAEIMPNIVYTTNHIETI